MEETRWKEKIKPLDENAMEEARAHWMTVGKPLFSLGSLEDAVIQIAGIKGTSDFELRKRGLIIMCADNGVVEEGVTQTGQEVTAIVADNFTRGETSVCKGRSFPGGCRNGNRCAVCDKERIQSDVWHTQFCKRSGDDKRRGS